MALFISINTPNKQGNNHCRIAAPKTEMADKL